jgi:hypothetical protein
MRQTSCENFVKPYQNNMASYPIRHLQLRTYNACGYTHSLDGDVGKVATADLPSCQAEPWYCSVLLVVLCVDFTAVASHSRAGFLCVGEGDSTHSVTRSPLFYNVMRPKFFKTLEMQMKLNGALLGYYASYNGNYLPTSGNNLSVPS